MTDAGLSRRTMLTVTGAGVALAACGGTGGASEADQSVSVGSLKVSFGKPLPWGLNPHDDDLEKEVAKQVPFNPAYVTVVRVYSDKGWSFGANHASAPAEANTLAQALRMLAKIAPKGNSNRSRLKQHAKELNLYKRKRYNPKGFDLDDFQSFGFNSQHAIYVFYDNKNVQLEGENLISFARFHNDGSDAAPNDSFFASVVTDSQVGQKLDGPVLLIRNYFASIEGNTIVPGVPEAPEGESQPKQAKKSSYALNLHFTLPPSRTGLPAIPMIIDPTTGNGMGTEP